MPQIHKKIIEETVNLMTVKLCLFKNYFHFPYHFLKIQASNWWTFNSNKVVSNCLKYFLVKKDLTELIVNLIDLSNFVCILKR